MEDGSGQLVVCCSNVDTASVPTLRVRLEIPMCAIPVTFHVVMGLNENPTRMELLPLIASYSHVPLPPATESFCDKRKGVT